MITNEKAFELGVRDYETNSQTDHGYTGDDLECYDKGWRFALRRRQIRLKRHHHNEHKLIGQDIGA